MTYRRFFGLSLTILMFIGLIGVSGYFYWKYNNELQKNPSRELNQLTREVSKILLIPESPLPTLATVTEKEKLATQDFFKNAENGDKVLIYVSEGKAVLYRPSIKKIIEVTQIQTNEDSETQSIQVEPVSQNSQENVEQDNQKEVVKIILLNGTVSAGITNNVEQSLINLSFNYEVTDKELANNQDYVSTQVIVINPKYTDEAQELADLLSASIETLPESEEEPNSDILVIVGSDYL